MSSGPATWPRPRPFAVPSRADALGVLSAVLAPAAAVMALVAVATSSLRLDGYGLAVSLPPAYYVALALLPLASGIEWLRGSSASSRWIVVHVVLFVVVVWLTPLILEGTPRFRTSYTNYGYVDPLVRGVGLLPSELIYHNWPLFPVVMSWLVDAGVPPLALLAAFPLVVMLAWLVPVAVILRMLEPPGVALLRQRIAEARAAARAARAAARAAREPTACRSCGRLLGRQAAFCRHCGTARTPALLEPAPAGPGNATAAPAHEPTRAPVEAPAPAEATARTIVPARSLPAATAGAESAARCGACGQWLAAGARFCRRCGAAVPGSAWSPAVTSPAATAPPAATASPAATAPPAATSRAASPAPEPAGPFAPVRDAIVAAWPVGLWIFAVFNWTSQDYFSPQALGYLLFLWWLVVVLHGVRRGGELDVRTTIAIVALFGTAVVTHLLTSLEMLGVLAVLVALRLIRRPTLFVTCALIFIVWQVDGAWPFFRFYGDRLQASVLDVLDFFQANVTSRVTGSAPHAEIATLRIVVTAVVYALAGFAVLLSFRRAAPRPALAAAISVLVGVAIVAPASVYGGEMMIRVLLFSLPMLGVLVASAFWRPAFRLIVIAALVVMAPVHILTHYGNELHDYVSPNELAGFAFVSSSLAPGNVFGGYPAANFENTALLDARNSYLSRSSQPSTLEDFLDPTLHHIWDHADWPVYVIVSRGDDAAMQLFQNRPGFIAAVRRTLDTDPRFAVVYRNPDVTIYRWLDAPTACATPSAACSGGHP